MSSVSMDLNLHYEVFSETTSLFGAALVVVVVFFIAWTRSYRKSCQSYRVEGLTDRCVCTKPIPEENEERHSEVKTMFVYIKCKITENIGH